MYKPISNPGNPPKKSVACDQVEKGKITDNQVDQLLCCSEISNSCSAYSSDCLGDDKRVAKCHNISSPSTFDACKRSDTRAARVCGWQNSLFCISVPAARTNPYYPHLIESIEWMTSRNTEAESHNTTDLNNLDSFVMACYNDTNKSYKLCDLGGDLVCGDLFKDTYKCCFQNCSLQGVLYREPIGELCEKSLITSLSPVTTTPTIITITTSSVTETMTFSSEKLNLYHDLAIGLPFASFSLGVFLVFVAKKVISKSWW